LTGDRRYSERCLVGGSGDATFRCHYCSDLLDLPPRSDKQTFDITYVVAAAAAAANMRPTGWVKKVSC